MQHPGARASPTLTPTLIHAHSPAGAPSNSLRPRRRPARSPFRKSWSGQAASAAQWTGEALELREGGQAARQAFLDSCMLPALDGLLAGEEWRQWEADLERMHCDPDQLAALLATHAAWRQQRVAAKLEGALREAAAQEHRDG